MTVTNNDMPNDLLGKYLNGDATTNEILLAEEWISASDTNRDYFAQLKITVEANNNIAHNEAAWLRLQNQISKNHSGRLDKPERKFKTRWVQLVASIALLCLIGYIIRVGLYSDPNINLNSDANVLTETLPDGTVVTLNAHSKLSYPAQFVGNNRVVSLIGEAFFKIATDDASPFVINLKGVTLNTTGCSALVKSRGGQTEITVEKGTVKVGAHDSQLLLKQGEMVISKETGTGLIKSISKGINSTWLKGRD
jgi:transmembrane sensor